LVFGVLRIPCMGAEFISMCYSPNALLSPLEISLSFSGGLKSFVEVCSQAFHAALCHGLQLEKLLLLSVHLAGANFCGSLASNRNSILTHFQSCGFCSLALSCVCEGESPFFLFLAGWSLRPEEQITHVCAWLAKLLSSGVGSKAFCMRSLRTSTTSTPEYDTELES
jgi:hypothetical protein